MRIAVIAAALLSAMSVPVSAAPNNTPHALDCMAKNGFTRDMWVARRAGTNAQVQSYIACRDGISVNQARAVGKKDGNFDTWKR
jgi:hypothetical protein